MISRRSFILPGLVLPFSIGCINVSGSESGWVTERDEKRFSVGGKPEVVLATFDGSIEVRSWDRSEVLVVVEKRAMNTQMAAAIPVEIAQEGDRITVEAKHPKHGGWAWFGPGNARLIVSVPQAADVRASSGDGAIRLENVTGTIALHSGDGRIYAAHSSGRVSATTGDGAIDLEAVEGDVVAATGDGRVKVAGRISSLRARSGDGSISISAEAGSAVESDWDISSGDGSVSLDIPDGFNANLEAHTGDGGIHLDGVSVAGSVKMSRNEVNGRLGAGGHALRVRTGDGSIRLRRS
jgi:hypothetical protein